MKRICYFHKKKSFTIFFSTIFSSKIKQREKLSYQDVSSEKWSLPGSSVVVDAAVVVVSSAFNDLKWMTIKISKMRKPFDGKLLSFIAEVFFCRDKTAEWVKWWILLCTFNGIFSYANYYLLSIKKQETLYRLWLMLLSPTSFSHQSWRWSLIFHIHNTLIFPWKVQLDLVSTLVQMFSSFVFYAFQ